MCVDVLVYILKKLAKFCETWKGEAPLEGFLNLLEPEFYIYILAHPVGKMRIIQEPNKLALLNKRHFEEKKNGDYAACLKYSVCIFVE